MKSMAQKLLHLLKEFIEPSNQPSPISLQKNRTIAILQEAQITQQDIHVIYNQQSFTGKLIKYDNNANQIILKNSSKNISVIIPIPSIQKISLVPTTISKTQY